MTDKELQQELRLRGYQVPLMVIRLWAKGTHSRQYSRQSVEKWLRWTPYTAGRPPRFPNFIAPFDVIIGRRMVRRQEEMRATPRLPRAGRGIA